MANNHSPFSTPQRHVLVVDDDPSIRLLCTTSLKNALPRTGVRRKFRGHDALHASAATIDLLLTDLFLPPPDFQLSSPKHQYPRVNGHDLLHQVLSLKKELRAIFMSSHTISSLTAQGITIGPERFLAKPFSVEQLLQQVAAALAAPAMHLASPAVPPSTKNVQWFDQAFRDRALQPRASRTAPRQIFLFPCQVADPQLDFFHTAMARARAAENPRSRSKAVLIEEITRGINKFLEVLAAIDDFSQEGFPYRDAARTKAELQFRECVRRAFGERSQEFQTYRNHKLHTSNKAEVVQSIALVKGLIQTLEDKKLELQGLKPPPIADPQAETSPVSTAQMRLVPPTAQVTMAPQPVRTPPPMTVSVAMTTNLGMPAAPAAATPQSPPAVPEPQTYAPLPAPPMAQSPISPAPPTPLTKALVTQATPTLHEEPASATPIAPIPDPPVSPIPAPRDGNTPPAQPAVTTSSVAPPDPKVGPTPPAPTMDKPVIESELPRPVPVAPTGLTSVSERPSTAQTTVDSRFIQPSPGQEPLQLIRKVCLRFHSVARQLRLRKDYRATLEVEDDYDLQDLLYALLKLEFEEVGSEEWTPPYTGGAPRTTLFVNRDQIAVVGKKTRSGLTTKELADQVAADSAYYRAQDKCATLFCFIYDPEGRIGSPKRLETNLTSVSEHCTVEVLVAPK